MGISWHLEKRYKSSWTIVIDLGRDPATGKQKRIYRSAKCSKKQAEQEAIRLVAEIQQGTYVEPDKTTIAEYLRHWVKTYCEPSLADSTSRGYLGTIEKHVVPEIGSIRLQELQPIHLQALYARLLEKGLSPRMAQLTHAILHRALKHAVLWQMLQRNPADAVQPPKPKRPETKALTKDDVERLLKALEGHRDYALVYTAIYTGMRRGELLAIRWSDVELEAGVITVEQGLVITRRGVEFSQPKTVGSRRSVPIPKSVCDVLKRHRKEQLQQRLAAGPTWHDSDLVFASPDGRPQNPATFSGRFGYTMKQLGFAGLRFHDLRHTHASLLLSLGVHPKVIQERLGHTVITTTMDIYAHVMPTLQRHAAEGLDTLFASPSSLNRRSNVADEHGQTRTTASKPAGK